MKIRVIGDHIVEFNASILTVGYDNMFFYTDNGKMIEARKDYTALEVDGMLFPLFGNNFKRFHIENNAFCFI